MAKLEASPAQRKFGQDKLDFHSAAPSTRTKRNGEWVRAGPTSVGRAIATAFSDLAMSFMTLVGAMVTTAAA